MLKTLLASKIVRLAIVILAIILAIFLIMLGIFVYSRPWDRAMFIDPVTKIDTQDKLIALTFDDGPSAKTTPALLDLLDKYEIKATFFVLGKNIEDHPEIAQNIYDSGHLLGNHSYDHPRFLFKTPSYTADQINKTGIIKKTGGQIIYFISI
jgi:peptidoglycan/xylan/chitin deacetylase (PgdA/CDA1 family)